jgi:hypothetical protein
MTAFEERLANIGTEWLGVIAVNEPLALRELVCFSGRRFYVREEITFEQFRAGQKANREFRRRLGLADGPHQRVGRGDAPHLLNVSEGAGDDPPADCTHFYWIERLDS